jgi:hypothetical protein
VAEFFEFVVSPNLYRLAARSRARLLAARKGMATEMSPRVRAAYKELVM